VGASWKLLLKRNSVFRKRASVPKIVLPAISEASPSESRFQIFEVRFTHASEENAHASEGTRIFKKKINIYFIF
jgi:hypothetical protein